jgi:hypothetical protein
MCFAVLAFVALVVISVMTLRLGEFPLEGGFG